MVELIVRHPKTANEYWTSVLDRYTFPAGGGGYETTPGLLPELLRLAAQCYASVHPVCYRAICYRAEATL